MLFKAISVVLFVCILGANAARKLSFENCDNSAAVRIHDVYLKSSYPILIRPNSKIEASGSFTNNDGEAPTEQSMLRIDFEIRRHAFWSTYVKIPCSLISGGCSRKVKCGDLPSPFPICPGPMGEQKFDESFKIPSNLNLGSLGSLLGKGKYKVKVDVRDDATNKRILCIHDATVEIKT